jgi:hypothetical protein
MNGIQVIPTSNSMKVSRKVKICRFIARKHLSHKGTNRYHTGNQRNGHLHYSIPTPQKSRFTFSCFCVGKVYRFEKLDNIFNLLSIYVFLAYFFLYVSE